MEPVASRNEPKVYSVAELTKTIRFILEDEVGSVWVEGELSNVRRQSSGHCYFTLKDATAQLSAVMFRHQQAGLKLELKEGLKVRLYGAITVYEPQGKYQIQVVKVEAAGRGDLHAAFERLKKKLADEGLFEPGRKKPLPMLPRHIGIVTSPTGAAIRDILNVLTRRFPNLHIQIAPVKVQGEGAAGEIVAAIDLFNARGDMDVLIVGRGGGSLEDLWAFNEEPVARAIARSRIPIISAVGHEIDFTISGFVADLRAPTPSAAAELVVGQKTAFDDRLQAMAQTLEQALRRTWLESKNRYERAARSYVFREPQNLIRQYAQKLDAWEMRLHHALKSAPPQFLRRLDAARAGLARSITRARQAMQLRLERAELRMQAAIGGATRQRGQEIKRLAAQLQALNPRRVLQRGYSITRRKDGGVIRTLDQAQVGMELLTEVADGQILSKAVELKAGDPHDKPENG